MIGQKVIANAVKGSKSIGINKFSIGGLAGSFGTFAGVNMLFGKEDPGTAMKGALRDTFLWEVVGGKVMWPYMIGADILPGVVTGLDSLDRQSRDRFKAAHKVGPKFSYKDTEQALTMRQASVQAIQGSKMNARNALGGEASLMHRGWGGRM